jgi:UDP-N-acetylmuramoylalanine--D-glutamate ligase
MKHYRKALVLGLGTSGTAATRLLLRERTRVTAIDQCDNAALRRTGAALRKLGATVILGRNVLPDSIGDFDVCITSPGIPADSKWIKAIEDRDVEVLSELELGASRCKCPMLAVTGSKGKSTLVKLCAEAIAAGGLRSAICGNYGTPICDAAGRSAKLDWLVVEVSSFQLEKVRDFKPHVGVLLNLQPDHLNRHGTMRAYAALKARLFRRMGHSDTGIVLDSISRRVKNLSRGHSKWFTFGDSSRADFRYYKDGAVSFRQGARRRTISFAGTIFENKILGLAAASAVAAVRACGVPAVAAQKAARVFKPLPHRFSHVATISGVRFINDSKATSLTALCAGVGMCNGPVRLIAGGLLKETNLKLAKKVLERAVKSVYLIGKASKEMEKAWKDATPCLLCGDLKTATRLAFADSSVGETILLSPGCASFDQFRNFEDRGDQFIGIVRSTRNEER